MKSSPRSVAAAWARSTARTTSDSRKAVSEKTIRNIWHQYGLQPHRVTRFKLSKDPHFVDKLRDVVGLYLNPPEKAVVFCVDEKSGIQALDRTRPVLPLRPRIPERQTHDYIRHGTTCLYAALRLLVFGTCRPTRDTKEFVRFLDRVEQATPADDAIHVILDNLSTHKSPPVHRWLRRHPRVHFHFIPTSSSWLNLVERWFGETVWDCAVRMRSMAVPRAAHRRPTCQPTGPVNLAWMLRSRQRGRDSDNRGCHRFSDRVECRRHHRPSFRREGSIHQADAPGIRR